MTVEYCATCGCSEFAHYTVSLPCTGDCDPDCPGDHDDPYGDTWECECGACNDHHYMEDPDAPACACGCLESDHLDEVEDEADEEDGDEIGVPVRRCQECDCAFYVEAGTAHEALLARLAERGVPWPAPRRHPLAEGIVRVRWFDEPLRIVGALVAAENGDPVRIDGLPDPARRLFLVFAETEDGLELAISREELL